MNAPERSDWRGTVLIVDDTPANLVLLSSTLEDAGYRVLVATDGAKALALLGHLRPDAILLDAVMPGMDGFELCQRLRSTDLTRDIPVIFMTVLSGTEDVIRALGEGAVDYVTKPLRETEILARIQTHVERARTLELARHTIGSMVRSGFLAATDGSLTWASEGLAGRLAEFGVYLQEEGRRLPEGLVQWLEQHAAGTPRTNRCVTFERLGDRLHLHHQSRAAHGEHLVTVEIERRPSADELAQAFALTLREADVLMWVAAGKTNRDIAEILGMSPRTVNKHLEHVFVKLGVETRTAAAARALPHVAGPGPVECPRD